MSDLIAVLFAVGVALLIVHVVRKKHKIEDDDTEQGVGGKGRDNTPDRE